MTVNLSVAPAEWSGQCEEEKTAYMFTLFSFISVQICIYTCNFALIANELIDALALWSVHLNEKSTGSDSLSVVNGLSQSQWRQKIDLENAKCNGNITTSNE